MSAKMPLAPLSHRALLLVEGQDAAHFLEGLVSSELPQEGEVCGSALLTPQGKLLFSFLVSRQPTASGDGFALECDASEIEGLTKRLTLYKLRAKVTLTPSDLPVYAGGSGGLEDTRHPDMGHRLYGEANASDTAESYHAHRASLGVLEGPLEIIANQDFPHDVALDLTGAVSFAKGCFVGQEVVSRVKHRGTARRRPVLVKGGGLEQGAPVMAGEREVGTMRLVSGSVGVAVVRIDQLKGALTVGGAPVTLAPPPYATYSLEPEKESEAT
jgi:folate-binding protein YgfZ